MSTPGSSGVRSIVIKMTVAAVLAVVPAVGLSIPVHATSTGSYPAAPPSTNSPEPPPPPPPGRQSAPNSDWNYGADGGGGGGGGG
jgi:hypothetical protein